MACMVFFCLTPAMSDLLTEKANEPRVDRARVEKLIAQLGDRDFARRNEAAKALREQGLSILPLLVSARSQSELEIRRRLDELISPLQTAQVLAPRRITLPRNRSAKDYAALIAAHSHYVLLAN